MLEVDMEQKAVLVVIFLERLDYSMVQRLKPLLSIVMLEELFKKIKSGYLAELLYADDQPAVNHLMV